MKHYLRLLSSSALIAALSFGTGLNCIPAGATGAADPDQWNISALIDRSEPYFGVSVGNGGIGILPSNVPFGISQVLMGNVYDENKEGISLALNAINPFVVRLNIDGQDLSAGTMTQTLDMRHAVHSTVIETAGARVSYEIRALRSMPNVGIVSVKVEAREHVSFSAEPDFSIPDGYAEPQRSVRSYKFRGRNCEVSRCSAATLKRGVRVSASNTILTDGASGDCKGCLAPGESATFHLIGSVVSDASFIDPFNESDREVVYVCSEGVGTLVERHEALWDELWQGDIRIEGDPDAQMATRLALYHLYSFVREGSRNSISPMGLSAQGYNGHVFWDTEIWMYPPMLFLNRGIAESMVDYRTDRLQAARDRAGAYGYAGAMYPWESDGAGNESCPVRALTGLFEHHITADIAIAAWNYYRMYGDRDWLRKDGWPMIKAVAEFWTSRVSRNDDGTWSIRNVICADEYAGGVDDNAFTNAAARCALKIAVKAAKAVGEKVDPCWKSIADGIRILRSDDGVTLEYEGYDGRRIKQADANLLAYPLGVVTDPDDILKDLEYYEGRINPKGPAMSYSILALQYARLGQGDKAYELFKRSYENNRLPPFGVLAECAGRTNPYFTTGAGGMLQCLINGFCGLELTDRGVKQLKSALPSHWKSITVTGVGPETETWTRQQR